MPELPEVETVRRSLESHLLNRRLTEMVIRRTDLRYPVPSGVLKRELTGGRLTEVGRRGKVLLLRFDRGSRAPGYALIHLGMSGRIHVSSPASSWEKHEHLRLRFGRRALRFIDPRRFGSVEYAGAAALDRHPRVVNLGVEPLSDDFDARVLLEGFKGRRGALRDLLLLGRVVAGVGNIYANEACFRAGLRPQRPGKSLKRAEAERLAAEIKAVLGEAIAAGGSTLSDGGYVDADGKAGWFQVSHQVYGRDGEACSRCETVIQRVPADQSARGAFYCSSCQK